MPGIRDSYLQGLDRVFALCLFLCFIIYFTLTVFKVVWIGDICRYIAALSALQTSFWTPGHEAVAFATSQETAVYTPFIVGAAILGQLFSLSPFATLQLAGVLNLLLYIVAIFHFFRVFSVNRRCWTAPALFLLVSLTVRRYNYGWSSETSLITFRWIQAYPSTFGWSLVLLGLAETELYLKNGRTRHLLLLGLELWALIISHIISAGWLLGLLVLRLIYHRIGKGKNANRSSLSLLGVIAASLFATLLWPYFNIFKIFLQTGYPEFPKFGQNLFDECWYPFLLGIPALLFFNLRRKHQLLLLWFTGTWAAFFLFRVLDIKFGARYIFFQLFFLHVATAELMTLALRNLLSRNRRSSRAELMLLSLCVLGIAFSPQIQQALYSPNPLESPAELWRLPASRQTFENKWGVYRGSLGPNDVILSPLGGSPLDELPVYLSAYTGCKGVTGLYTILLPDSDSREAAVKSFFDLEAPWPDRKSVLERYNVTRVIVARSQEEQCRQIGEHLGSPIFNGEDFIVFSVPF